MKVKIKMKTLIGLILLGLVLVLIVVPLVNLRMGIHLNHKGSEKAEVFFENYMASPVKVMGKQGLYEYGNSLVKGLDKYKITFSGWGGGDRTSPEDMEKAMEAYEKVLEKDKKNNYKSKYSIKSYEKLLDTSMATLDGNRLMNWIEWGKDKDNMEMKNTSILYEAYYYFVQKDYSKAEEILEAYVLEEKDPKYYHLMGDINIHQGNIEKAKEYYDLSTDEDTWPSSPYFGGNNGVMDSYVVKEYLNKINGEYKIKGKITYDGKGLPFIDVYVNKNIGGFSTGGEKPDAITDENGEFETLGLKQGVYNVGVGINPSQLYNKVFLEKDMISLELNRDTELNFEFARPMEIKSPKDKITIKEGEDIEITWDSLEEVEYYTVESIIFSDPGEKSGSYFSLSLEDKIGKDRFSANSMIFNIENLDKRMGGLIFEGEDEIVSPTGIIGSFIPEFEYPFLVNAYNKKDELIGSSFPLISDYEDMLTIEMEGSLSKGETLILDKKYVEAISHYEDKLVEDPKNKEALLYLSRIYVIGWKKGEKNIPKGLKYAERYDELYDDLSLSLESIYGLWGEDLKENKESVIKILENIPEEKRDTDYYSEKARYYLMEEDFEKAKSSYEKMTDYKSIDMVYIDMYLANYDEAIETLESGELEIREMNTRNVIEGINNVSSASKEDKAFLNKTLKGILTNSFSRKEENTLYKEIPKKVTDAKLQKMLEEIGKEEYWNQY